MPKMFDSKIFNLVILNLVILILHVAIFYIIFRNLEIIVRFLRLHNYNSKIQLKYFSQLSNFFIK